jgi:peptidoglycan/LPS O-acetylase OafA/YrhL
MTRRQPVDRMVGELSYPVYLLHYTVVLLVTAAMAAWKLPETLRGEMAALVSVAAAVLVQATLLGPFEKWRQRIVQRHATATSGGGSAR